MEAPVPRASGAVAYVASHGALEPTGGETFVPAGTTVVFHAAPGTPIATLAGARVLEIVAERGQESFTGPTDPRADPVMVPNYTLKGFSDLETALILELSKVDESQTAHLYFVGDHGLPDNPTQMCTDLAGCRARKDRRHRCRGVFGVLGATYTRIQLTCCRIDKRRGWSSDTHEVPGDDPNVLETAYARAQYFLSLIEVKGVEGVTVTDDPESLAAAQAYYDKLSPKDQDHLLLTDPVIITWFEISAARRFLRDEGVWGLYVYYWSQDAEARKRIRSSKELAAHLRACDERNKTFNPIQPADIAWFDALPTRDRRWLIRASDGIATWVRWRSEVARRVLGAEGILAPYLALTTDPELAAAAYSDPALAERARQVTIDATAFTLAFDAPDHTREVDAERRARYEGLPPAEQAAMAQLSSRLLRDLAARERLRVLLDDSAGIAGYHQLQAGDELDHVRDHAHTASDIAARLDEIESNLAAWSAETISDSDNGDTLDKIRTALWQSCSEDDRQALYALYPDITTAWLNRH